MNSSQGYVNSNSGDHHATNKHGIVLILASVMPVMAVISLVPVLPLLLSEFSHVEGSEFLVPIAMTVPALCVAIFSPLAGWLSDKTGRKPILVGALLLYSIIGLLPFFLTDLFQIIVSRIVLGMAEAAIMTIATALIGDYFSGKARERWVTIQVASVSLSAIVLIAVGGGLGEALGSRGPFVLYLAAIPIALCVALLLFEPNVKKSNVAFSQNNLPWLRVLPLLAITLFVGIIFYAVIVKLGEILSIASAVSVSPAVIGGIGAAVNIGVAAGSMTFRKFTGISGQAIISFGLFLASIGYLGAALSTFLWATSVSAIIVCIGCGILLPTMLTWILRELPDNVRGRGTGLWTGAFFLGQFTAPIFMTALEGLLGDLPTVLIMVSVVSIIGAGISLLKAKGAPALVSQ